MTTRSMPAGELVVSEVQPARSRRLTIIVVQHSAQPLAPLDRSVASAVRLFLHDQPVAQSLMVALPVIMLHEFADGLPQRAFSEQNHPSKHDSLMVLTKRSAWALRFGERDGSF